MTVKKDRGRFSIKFNENDPSHKIVIKILEEQGPHSKAPFIANAILHYIHCTQTPDITSGQVVDKTYIRELVFEILSQQKAPELSKKVTEPSAQTLIIDEQPMQQLHSKTIAPSLNDQTLAMISDTLSAFRKTGA